MDTLASNIRIARFMGETFNPSHHRYHVSYDTLVPVLEKIETLNNHGFDVHVHTECTVIDMMRSDEHGQLHAPIDVARYGAPDHDYNRKIDHIYGAVLQFLDWLEARHRDTDSETSTNNPEQ
jgi:hypothetical protein